MIIFCVFCLIIKTIFEEITLIECITDSWMNTTILVASLFAKCMIGGSFSTIYQQGGELFPTPVRSNAVGFINVVGNLGNIVAPFIQELKIGTLSIQKL